MPRVSFKELKNFKYRINPEERQGSYGYYFMRKISFFFTWLFLNLGFSANQVTFLQILAGILGSIFLAFKSIKFLLLGIFFLQLGFLFDNIDGEIARYRKEVSLTGKYLDTIGHEIVVPLMYFMLAVGSYLRTDFFPVLIFGFLAGLFSLRLDITTIYLEVGQMLESKLYKTFKYYVPFQISGKNLKLYKQKNEASPARIIYACFAYPGIMNVFTLTVFIQWLLPEFKILNQSLEPVAILLIIYGILIPPRRAYTIWKLVQHREAERKFNQLTQLRKAEFHGEKIEKKSQTN